MIPKNLLVSLAVPAPGFFVPMQDGVCPRAMGVSIAGCFANCSTSAVPAAMSGSSASINNFGSLLCRGPEPSRSAGFAAAFTDRAMDPSSATPTGRSKWPHSAQPGFSSLGPFDRLLGQPVFCPAFVRMFVGTKTVRGAGTSMLVHGSETGTKAVRATAAVQAAVGRLFPPEPSSSSPNPQLSGLVLSSPVVGACLKRAKAESRIFAPTTAARVSLASAFSAGSVVPNDFACKLPHVFLDPVCYPESVVSKHAGSGTATPVPTRTLPLLR
ncbi:hypothetical protein K488DRAFT_82219 [Vararia minispora EC-137]|uniref:Uncharacterized protein n=1 Tax=Vararia minispora EC-137 TaxID=1314806 RepID=A0ACB8QWL9_9AGAM|nr:hypothetical protein K488DRAFT_82219 [Vararia minispora EC-137]